MLRESSGGRSGTLVFKHIDPDTFEFQITERKESGTGAEDTPTITFHRVATAKPR